MEEGEEETPLRPLLSTGRRRITSFCCKLEPLEAVNLHFLYITRR